MSFFGGMPFPVQFFLAFVIVLGLIGATAWAVRRFGSGRLGGVGIRGRQPRLGVVDYASVDARRRLILVRRDNVEHLMMIGGPTDIVVEANIVRAVALPGARQPGVSEAPSRAIPLPDGIGNEPSPEPALPLVPPRAARAETISEEPAAFPLQPQTEPTPRPQRETLVALADELSIRPATPSRSRTQAATRPHPPEPRSEQRSEARQEPRSEPRQEPRIAAPHPTSAASAAAADQSLAEMAHRLEAALRKPTERTDSRAAPIPRAVTAADHAAPAEAAVAGAGSPSPPPSTNARAARSIEVKSPRADAKQSNPGKALYDSLEQEMASLLGRPTAKTRN